MYTFLQMYDLTWRVKDGEIMRLKSLNTFEKGIKNVCYTFSFHVRLS